MAPDPDDLQALQLSPMEVASFADDLSVQILTTNTQSVNAFWKIPCRYKHASIPKFEHCSLTDSQLLVLLDMVTIFDTQKRILTWNINTPVVLY